MNERIMQFRVGVMILATIMIAAILVLMFVGSSPLLQGRYTVYIKFREAPGVTRLTPVRKAGIRIGRVTNVQFADDDTAVLVTAEIDRGRQIYSNEVCKATNSLLMGDASLEFVRNPRVTGEKTVIEDNAVLMGEMAQDTARSIASLQAEATQVLGTVDAAGRDMHNVLTRVDRLLEMNEQRITRVIGEMDATLQLLHKALENSNDIVGDPKVREQIKQTIAEMPLVLKEARTTITRLDGSIASLERNLKDVEGLTEPLGKHGAAMVERLNGSTQKLDTLMDEMLKFTAGVNNSQGSIGQLLHDPELYNHVTRAAKNIEALTRDVRPILDDVRVFTDKLARHPEVLGVRGAIQRNPGIK